MKKVIFLGPSLRLASPPAEIEVRPPVKQGDVLRALHDGATHIGIVDGYFDQVPSVWHKEILFAIERDAKVYGAASMGALRAAELGRYGMIGIGLIFEMYRSGALVDDDEVALLHGPANTGYMPVSEAMVNLRDRLDAAVEKNLISREEADAAAAQLKALPYPMRSVRALLQIVPALTQFVTHEAGPSLKERDALSLLDRLRDPPPNEMGTTMTVPRTVFLERLRLEVLQEKNDPDAERIAARIQGIDAADVSRLAAAFPRARFHQTD